MLRQLIVVQNILRRFPASHVGGSIGLLLHGVGLNRDLKNSDVDMTFKNDTSDFSNFDSFKEGSNGQDFDYQFKQNGIKVEVNVKPEITFCSIAFEGFTYRVTNLEYILFYKRLYADKGVQKHIDDLKCITDILTFNYILQ